MLVLELIIEYTIILVLCPFLVKKGFALAESSIKFGVTGVVSSHVYSFSPIVNSYTNFVHIHSPIGRGFGLNSILRNFREVLSDLWP